MEKHWPNILEALDCIPSTIRIKEDACILPHVNHIDEVFSAVD